MHHSLSTNICRQITLLGATHYSLAKNYNKPYQHSVSSIHFFTSNVPDHSGALPEIAYFIPDLHSRELGALSGFKEISRLNSIDNVDVKPIPSDVFSHTNPIVQSTVQPLDFNRHASHT